MPKKFSWRSTGSNSDILFDSDRGHFLRQDIRANENNQGKYVKNVNPQRPLEERDDFSPPIVDDEDVLLGAYNVRFFEDEGEELKTVNFSGTFVTETVYTPDEDWKNSLPQELQDTFLTKFSATSNSEFFVVNYLSSHYSLEVTTDGVEGVIDAGSFMKIVRYTVDQTNVTETLQASAPLIDKTDVTVIEPPLSSNTLDSNTLLPNVSSLSITSLLHGNGYDKITTKITPDAWYTGVISSVAFISKLPEYSVMANGDLFTLEMPDILFDKPIDSKDFPPFVMKRATEPLDGDNQGFLLTPDNYAGNDLGLMNREIRGSTGVGGSRVQKTFAAGNQLHEIGYVEEAGTYVYLSQTLITPGDIIQDNFINSEMGNSNWQLDDGHGFSRSQRFTFEAAAPQVTGQLIMEDFSFEYPGVDGSPGTLEFISSTVNQHSDDLFDWYLNHFDSQNWVWGDGSINFVREEGFNITSSFDLTANLDTYGVVLTTEEDLNEELITNQSFVDITGQVTGFSSEDDFIRSGAGNGVYLEGLNAPNNKAKMTYNYRGQFIEFTDFLAQLGYRPRYAGFSSRFGYSAYSVDTGDFIGTAAYNAKIGSFGVNMPFDYYDTIWQPCDTSSTGMEDSKIASGLYYYPQTGHCIAELLWLPTYSLRKEFRPENYQPGDVFMDNGDRYIDLMRYKQWEEGTETWTVFGRNWAPNTTTGGNPLNLPNTDVTDKGFNQNGFLSFPVFHVKNVHFFESRFQ